MCWVFSKFPFNAFRHVDGLAVKVHAFVFADIFLVAFRHIGEAGIADVLVHHATDKHAATCSLAPRSAQMRGSLADVSLIANEFRVAYVYAYSPYLLLAAEFIRLVSVDGKIAVARGDDVSGEELLYCAVVEECDAAVVDIVYCALDVAVFQIRARRIVEAHTVLVSLHRHVLQCQSVAVVSHALRLSTVSAHGVLRCKVLAVHVVSLDIESGSLLFVLFAVVGEVVAYYHLVAVFAQER